MRVSNIPYQLSPNPVVLPEKPDPFAKPDTGQIYVNDVATVSELMYMDDSGDEVQITLDGFLNGAEVAMGAAAANRVVVTTGAGLLTTDAQLTYDVTTDVLDLTGSLRLSSDVQLSRGAANRLDLAAGDTLNLVNEGALGTPSLFFGGDTDTGMWHPAGDTLAWSIAGAEELRLNATNLQPGANDGLALGVSGGAFADLFLASGAVVNFAAGDVTITHSANTLAFAGASSGYTFDAVINSNNAIATSITLQTQTFTAGAAHNAVLVNPTWAAENFSHTAVQISPTQNGANSSSVAAIGITLTKATGATILDTLEGVVINSLGVTGTVTTAIGVLIDNLSTVGGTSSFGIRFASQTANATTTRAIELVGTGISNAIRLGSSANIYANAAEDVRFMDSTNARGVALTLTAAGAQTVGATAGNLSLSVAGGAEVAITGGNVNLGGNVLVGATAASGSLTFRATSSATDGAIIFQTDPTTEAARILSTGELLLGRTTLIAASHILTAERNQNTPTTTICVNQTAGTAALASLAAYNGTNAAAVGILSTAYTVSGPNVQGGAYLTAGNAPDLLILTETAAPIRFATNNVERARIISTGELLVGATAQLGTEIALFRRDQNAASVHRLHNDTSGTAAQIVTLWTNATDQGAIALYSPLFTPAGGITGSQFTLTTNSGCTGGLNIRTHTTAIPIIFTVNAVEVARFVGTTGIAQFAPPAQSTGTTALLNITSAVNTAGAVPYFSVTGAASTGQTLSTEIAFANFNFGQTVTWATGALTTERAFLVQAPTLAFAAASTVTTAVTASITAACGAGTNATITNSFGLQVGGAVTLGATAAGTVYGAVDVPGHTITYTGATQITSVGPAGLRIGTLTITDASAVTIDTAAALYIAAAPAQAGSVTLTTGYSIWADAGPVRFDDHVRFGAGVAVVAAQYSVGRDADGTNQLHLNVPTGGTFELSVNDAAEMTLSATAVNFQNNTITTTGGGSLTGTWSDLGSVTTVDINGGTIDGTTIGAAVASSIIGTTIDATTDFTIGGTVITNGVLTDADFVFTQSVGTTGSVGFTFNIGAHTAITAATERSGVDVPGVTKTWAAGAGPLALQREINIAAPTYVGNAGGALTITDAATLYINAAPTQGANMTLTSSWALMIDAGAVRLDDHCVFGAGVAVTAARYSVGRDADGTNQLHLNVPTGATLEFSVNDAAVWTSGAAVFTTVANTDINMSAGGRIYGGGVQPNTQTLAANTSLTLDENDSCVTVTTGAVSVNTVTLPAASGNQGMIVSVYVTVDGGQNCNVVRAGADVIQNGSADLSNTQVALDDAGDYVLLQCVSSTEWQVVVNSGGTVT